MRALRTLMVLTAGTFAGLTAAALFLKRALPSQGDEDSNELSLVAVLDGVELKSRATAFRGGSMFALIGGIEADLTDAKLAPGAQLSVHALVGGIEVEIPPGWRVESNVKAISGGVDVPDDGDPDAPVLVLDGLAVMGGIQVSVGEPDASSPANAADPSTG
jgi:hypothetical protein